MRDSLKIRAIGWLSAMLVATLAGPTHAVDLLELPAIQSEVASRGLLLDATARGEGALVAVGSFGVIIKSEDSGATWTQASVPASVTLTAVDFPTPEKGWAVGHDGLIVHSDDGGKTWRKQLDGHQLNEQVVAVAERIVEQVRQEFEALQAEEEPDEYALEDAEFMLEEAEFALEGAMDDTAAGPVRPLLDVWFRNEREGFVLGSYGMLIVTEDGGENWELVSDRMDNPEAFHLNQLSAAPDGTLFIAGEAGFIYRSSDGGESWETLEPGYEGSFYGIVIVPDVSGTFELLAYGLRGNLFRSTDRGDSWESLDSGTTVTLTNGKLLSDGTVFLVGQGGTILTRAPSAGFENTAPDADPSVAAYPGSQSFEPARNSDRRVISGLQEMSNGNVLLVGLGGVRLSAPDGTAIELPADEK
jgi:photosystem II stability/assembly factor-like uncharacterized protein